MRGCGRGCDFAMSTNAPKGHIPLSRLQEEAKIKYDDLYRLQSDEMLLYGCDFVPCNQMQFWMF